MQEREIAEKNRIFEVLVGSHLYGFATPTSDEDLRGVFIAPSRYNGPFFHVEQCEFPGGRVLYELKKAFKLFSECNPNMLDILFAPRDFWRFSTDYWNFIYEHRYKFLSTKVRYSFSGYAFAQLQRMKRHREWLVNPPKKKPERSEFNLGANPSVPIELRKVLTILPKGYIKEELSLEAKRELDFHSSITVWNQYEEWLQHRNPTRAAAEEKVGYDTKNAQHLVRLMRMAKEILTTGEVQVVRKDAEDLRKVREGQWSYDDLIKWATDCDSELEEYYKSGKSPLPHSSDLEVLNTIYEQVTREYFDEHTT